MRLSVSIAAFLISTSAATAECPVGNPPQMEAVVKAIKETNYCHLSIQVFDKCLFGSTADVQTAAAVVEKCEPGVAPRYKDALEREYKTCNIKYATKDGTMYRSMTAACLARAAYKYNHRSIPRASK